MSIALPLDDPKKMGGFVDRRHPAYMHHIDHWRFCEETVKGGREWFAQNVHCYLKEGTREYADRVRRAYRFNHTKEIVLLLTKYIFKQGVIRNDDDASDAVKRIWKHTNLEGVPIDVFMKQVSDLSSETGRVWMVIDSKMGPGELISRADEKQGQGRIYAYLVHQKDMLDFSLDEWGQLNWVLYRTPHRDDADPINSDGLVKTRYVLWSREQWFIIQEDWVSNTEVSPSVSVVVDPINAPVFAAALKAGLDSTMQTSQGNLSRQFTLIDQGINELGEIPIFPVNHVESGAPYAPPGLIDDIAYLDRAVANYLSNLDAIIQDQTFSQLVMPARGLAPGEDEYAKMTEMGTKRVFLFDNETGSGAAPQYISPDAAQAQIIVAVIRTIIGEIYHSVGMAGERTKQDNASGIDNSSGVAKAYDFDRMNALLLSKAAMLQRAENRLIYFVRRWAGEAEMEDPAIEGGNFTGGALSDEADSLVKYPEDYDVRGLPDEFENAQSLILIEAPDTVRRQQMQNLVEKLFPRLGKALKAAMQAELKAWPPDPMSQLDEQLQIQSKYGQPPSGSITATPGGASGGSKPVPGAKAPGKSKQGQNNKGA